MYGAKPILLIENDPAYSKNIVCAIEDMDMQYPLIHLNKSEDVLNYLRSQRKKPWLILLGLNNQDKDGFNLLKIIKTDDQLRIIPLVILADSNEDQNIVQSYELGVAGYIVKSQDTYKVADIIKTVLEYWTLSELPPDRVQVSQEFGQFLL